MIYTGLKVEGHFQVHQLPGGCSLQHHYENEVDVRNLSWPVASLGAMEPGDSLRHQHTFQVQIPLSSLSCGARTVEM